MDWSRISSVVMVFGRGIIFIFYISLKLLVWLSHTADSLRTGSQGSKADFRVLGLRCLPRL
jgi:hypothetical protein